MNDEFKIERDEYGGIIYTKIQYEDGQILEADHMNRIENYMEDIYSILNAKPEIECEPILYTSLGSEVRLQFNVKARGDINITIKKGLNIVYSKKTSERSFDIPIIKQTSVIETNIYTIEIQDNLSNSATATITNIIIDANLQIIPNINKELVLGYDKNQPVNLNLENNLYFNIKGNKPILASYPLEYSINNEKYVSILESYVEAQEDETNKNYQYIFNIPQIVLGTFNENTTGQINFRAKMQLEENGDIIYTSPVTIKYYLVENNTIEIQVLNNTTITSNDKLIVEYKILAPNVSEDKTFKVKGEINGTSIVGLGIPNNTKTSLNFGLLPTSVNPYELKWYLDDSTIAADTTLITVIAGADYVSDKLLAYFSAAEPIAQASGYNGTQWKPKEGSLINDIFFNLYGGYVWNIDEQVTEKEQQRDTTCSNLLLQPNGYGILQNFEALETLLSEGGKPLNFSLELYYKATDIGELKAPVITTADANNATTALTVYHNGTYAYIKDQSIEKSKINLLNNKWNHLVFVITQKKDENPLTNIEDTEYFTVIKTYLNGCLIDCVGSNTDVFTWPGDQSFSNLTLNGYYKNGIQESGKTQYELIRLYEKGLTASEVLLNYKHAIQYTKNDTNSAGEIDNLYQEVVNRNNDTSIAKIFFIRNRYNNITEQNPPPGYNTSKIEEYVYFDGERGLNKITKKKKENPEDQGPYSKSSAVNCTAFLFQDGKIEKYPNMDVYLQGTSSLLYPVKNYQVKNYNNPTKKEPFLPLNVDATIGESWGGPKGDYVYTLKCDYMEHSHKNNTPTARYYDEVLNNITSGDKAKYSPPRQNDENNIYRDSITGFPVLVYYSDNLDDIDLTSYDKTTQGLENVLIAGCKNTGSYMFNIDKEGKALGFEYAGDPEGENNENYFPIKDYYISLSNENYQYIWNAQELSFKFENSPQTNDLINGMHLYSYGYKYNESGEEKTERCCELIDCGEVEFNNEEDGLYTITIKEPLISNNLIPLCLSEVVVYKKPQTNYCVSLEGTANSQDKAAATFYTLEECSAERLEYNEKVETEKDKLSLYASKFDYYAATLEPRYSYAAELDYSDEECGYCDYAHLDRCIKFFKILDRKPGFSNTDIKNEFERLFSKEYCLTYYLQMLMFIQVDNSGKNAMFDSWDDGKFYPRPYDMDTQMGLTNTGYDTIPTSAELKDSSSLGDTGFSANPDWRYEGTGKGTDPNAQRLTSYNTRNSKLWDFIAEYYKTDILNLYINLRNNIYTENNICNYVNELTSKQISETQYNKDAFLKYLFNPEKKDYFYVIAGNRDDRYRQVIRERLIFLDSVFEVKDFSKNINMRADASGQIIWNFSSFSPQYVTITSGQGTAGIKIYVSPDLEYVVREEEGEGGSKIYVYNEGMKLTYKNLSTNRETAIYGVHNLKFINNLSSALPSELKGLSEASKMSIFDLQNASSNLSTIDLSGNKNLNKVTINNCVGISSISLTGATKLKEVDLTGNTGLTSLGLPTSSPLTKINLTNCSNLETLELKNLPNLTIDGLILTNCLKLNKLVIENCPLLSEINLNNLTGLTEVQIKACDTLTTLICKEHKNLNTLVIENCINLENINLQKSRLTSLNLSVGNNKIKNIDLSGSEQLTTLSFNTTENFVLNLNGCIKLSKINSTEFGTYNFSGLPTCTSLCCNNNDELVQIESLKYQGSGNLIFYQCEKLVSIKNSNFLFKDSLDYAFGYDNALSNLTNTTFNMNSDYQVKSMSMAFYNCYSLPTKITDLLNTFVYNNDKLTSLNYAFTSCKGGQTSWTLDLSKLSKSITNLSMTFNNTNLVTINNQMVENSQLSNASGAFANNNLTSIPNNIFTNCNKLTSANYCFSNNIQLTDIPNTMFMNDTSPLYNQGNRTYFSAEGLFAGCTALNNSSQIKTFLNNNPRIEIANKMFYNTGYSKLPNGLFNNLTILSSAIAMFANCINLDELPNYLVENNENNTALSETERINHQNKTRQNLNCGGLFTNCTALEGYIPATLFNGLRQYIISLGAEKTGQSADDGRLYSLWLGAFSNTKLTHYEILNGISPFSDMNNLQNISYLFAQANYERIETTTLEQFYIKNKAVTNEKFFKGWGTATQEGTGIISFNIFAGDNNITDIRGVFMGTGITEIEVDNNVPKLFGEKMNKITDISNLFANSNLGVTDNTSGLLRLMEYLPNITIAKYSFSDTALSDISTLLNYQTKLEDISGMFAGCKLNPETPLSIDYFKNIKNSLQYANYTFARTTLQQIEDQKPTKYILDNVQILFVNDTNIIKTFVINEENNLQEKDSANIIEQISINSIGAIVLKYKDNETAEILDNITKINLQFNIENNLNAHREYSFYGARVGTTTFIKLFSMHEFPIAEDGIYSYTLTEKTATTNLDTSLVAVYQYILSSVDNSLFYDCKNLKSIEGFFFESDLQTIPTYIFASSQDFTSLTNIAYMFGNCKNCNNTDELDKEVLFASSWLELCPKITNISGLCYSLGFDIANDEYADKNKYDLGIGFNYIENITQATCAFANIPHLIQNTSLTNSFMYNSLVKDLQECAGIFAISPLTNIIEVFNATNLGNIIKNLNYAFSYCVSSGLQLPLYTRFNKKPQCIWTWLPTGASTDRRGWPNGSYTLPPGQADPEATILDKLDEHINSVTTNKNIYVLHDTTKR